MLINDQTSQETCTWSRCVVTPSSAAQIETDGRGRIPLRAKYEYSPSILRNNPSVDHPLLHSNEISRFTPWRMAHGAWRLPLRSRRPASSTAQSAPATIPSAMSHPPRPTIPTPTQVHVSGTPKRRKKLIFLCPASRRLVLACATDRHFNQSRRPPTIISPRRSMDFCTPLALSRSGPGFGRRRRRSAGARPRLARGLGLDARHRCVGRRERVWAMATTHK